MNKFKVKHKKFLKKKRAFLFITVLCMGIGFAFLTSNLTITGNTSVSGNKWNVYFTNVQVTEGSVEASVVPTTTGINTTSLEYTVTLDKPGDFYEFTVDAVNDGTINAMIQNINMTSLDTNVAKYLTYTVTYLDGKSLLQNDVLKKNKVATYKVRVEFKKNIFESDLSEENINLSLFFGVDYVQSTLSNAIDTEFTRLVKDSAISDKQIDFSTYSSETNGRGLYILNNTKNDEYPIYYYRGKVNNNNALFAGFCWKIVRTTETGGTKLIYNGTPNENNQCVYTTQTETQIGTTTFTENSDSPAYVGYMYGTEHKLLEQPSNNNYIYGNSYSYSDGIYTLVNTRTGLNSTHHYTCLSSTETTCASISYVYHEEWNKINYMTLSDGKSLNDILAEASLNITSSKIKIAVDNWFNNTFRTYFTTNDKDYNNYLEDTIWCNDRSKNTIDVNGAATYMNSGWNPDGGNVDTFLYFTPRGRFFSGNPTLSCENKNDSFTVNESSTGNGALTYPVGLLTMSELVYAGNHFNSSTDSYLYTSRGWWTMSPGNILRMDVYLGQMYGAQAVFSAGGLTYGIRPSISLKSGVRIASGGDGTSAHPYEFLVD